MTVKQPFASSTRLLTAAPCRLYLFPTPEVEVKEFQQWMLGKRCRAHGTMPHLIIALLYLQNATSL